MSDDAKFIKIELEMAQMKDAVIKQNQIFESHTKDDAESNKKHIELLERVSDQMEETQKCFVKLDKKLDISIQKMDYELRAINKLDEEQNRLIDEHIEGVNTLKDIYQLQKSESELRFIKLEEPAKVRKIMFKWTIGAGSMAGAIYYIGRLFEWF